MSNFYRAFRQTFKYPILIVAVLICAFMIGILWGGNIGAVVYPITEVCLEKETFTSWIDKKIDESEKKIASLENEIHTIPSHYHASSLKSLQRDLLLYHWIRPYLIEYTPNDPFQTVVFLMAVVLVGTVLKLFFIICHGILSARIAERAAMQIREQFFEKILRYEVGFFNREGIADTMSRFTNDMAALTKGLSIIYGKVIREPLKMLVCLIGAAYISWQLLLITLLLVPMAAIAIRWLARSIKRVVRRSMEEMANLYGRLEETFRSIRIVKAFTREEYELEKFQVTNWKYCAKAMKIAKYESLANPMTELFGILMICIAIMAGAWLLMQEQTSLFGIPMLASPLDKGSLFLFFGLLAGAADPARKLSDIFTQFQSAAAAADRIYAMIDREIPIREAADPKPMPLHRKSIRFEKINFEYESERSILKNVDLEIHFGECIAILGSSGCGKSTLLNLLPRFIDPQSGRILIDEQPIDEVQVHDLRNQIGLVTQEPVLFNDTVLNNILYGRLTATPEEAVEAAKKAFAHDFIEKELVQGYETVIGPAGGQLSGGQRQRIALARAILRDPSIFLLDEATSQIDIASEKMIHQSLEEFKQGRTTIMVTHRLSALSLADRIVLMQDGKIHAIGTHEELLQSESDYAKLY